MRDERTNRGFLRFTCAVLSLFWCASVLMQTTLPKRREILHERMNRYSDIIQRETDWLSEASLSNGAIAFRPTTDGEAYVNPYFSCYTILALLGGTTEAEQMETAQRAIDWHFSHLNTQAEDVNRLAATIYDYTAQVENGSVVLERTDKTYDSTDSYAAAFLLVLDRFYRAGGSEEYLLQHYPDFSGVLSAMLTTLTKDGLTNAKPSYAVEYLMDNCEVWLALGAAEHLLNQLFLPALRKDAADSVSAQRDLARTLAARKTIEDALETKLWHASDGYYAPSMSNSVAAGFDRNLFYADAVSQLCPIIFGVISPNSARAKSLYELFCARWGWDTLSHVSSGATLYYWGMIADCAAQMGDASRLDRFLQLYQSEIMPDHAMPLFNSDAAWVVLACQLAYDDCREQLNSLGVTVLLLPVDTVRLRKHRIFARKHRKRGTPASLNRCASF